MFQVIAGSTASRLGRHAGVRVFRLFVRKLGAADAFPCRWLGVDEAAALSKDTTLDLDEAKVRAAYGRGDLCIAAYEGGALAGYCWFATAPVPHMDRAWIAFPPHLVYTYKSYVRPQFRGRGLAAAMYRAADPIFLERARSHALICVESHNRISVAAARRAGFDEAGYAAYVDAVGLRAWCSPAAARLGLRFFLPH